MATKKKLPDDCMPQCGTCAFMERDHGETIGYCRRYPPVLIGSDESGTSSAFPVITNDDWCGEFRRKLQG